MIERSREPDPMLRRFERNQPLTGLLMAMGALVFGRPAFAFGVACGTALMAFSYRAIKGGVDVIVTAAAGTTSNPADAGSHGNRAGPIAADVVVIDRSRAGDRPRRRWALAARFVGRYALLALAAYVMLAYLHAHPVGMLLGAASPVVAVAVEAVRFLRTASRPGQS